MNYRLLIALLAVAAPIGASRYSPASSNPYSNANSIDDIVNAAAGGSAQVAQNIQATAESQPSPAESARLVNAQTQLQALNANPTYSNFRNSEDIAESLATSQLTSNIRQGNLNLVPPNLVEQDVHRSMLVPTGQNNHQVITTQPLPPIVVTQPGAPPAQISSGPAAVVRAAPVIYKIRPSVIYQQEVINRIPTPLSLNPVYVKVYKAGKEVNVPTAPVVQPTYQNNYPAAASDAYSAALPAYNSPSLAYTAPESGYGAAASSPANAAYNAPQYSSAAAPAYNSVAPAYSASSVYPAPNYQQASY